MAIDIKQTGIQYKELIAAIPPREFTATITQDKDNADTTKNLVSRAKFDGHWGMKSMAMVIETAASAPFPDATLKVSIAGVVDYVEGDLDHRDILFDQTVQVPMNSTQRLAPISSQEPHDAGMFLAGYPVLEITATWENPLAFPDNSDDTPPTAKLVMTCYP